jgi:predicted dehydrogenase
MDKKVFYMSKVAIAGCGLIGSKEHIPAFLKLQNRAQIVAVCDLNEGLAKEAVRKFNIRKYYTNFSDMLLTEKPDIVDICTPPMTHAQLAVEALEKGAHVLLEKPMALKDQECQRMIEVAQRQNRKIGVIHNQIFNPAFVKAREMLQQGDIGNFLAVHIFLSTPTTYMTTKKDHWAHRLPGGVIGETGPHGAYLALAFLKNIYDVELRAKKLLPEYPWSNFEDFNIILSAENGLGFINFTYGSNQWAACVDIVGTKGILKVDLEAQSVVKYQRRELKIIPVGLSVLSVTSQEIGSLVRNAISYVLRRSANLHYIGISKFLDGLLDDQPLPITADEGRESVRLLEMIVNKMPAAG